MVAVAGVFDASGMTTISVGFFAARYFGLLARSFESIRDNPVYHVVTGAANSRRDRIGFRISAPALAAMRAHVLLHTGATHDG
jgi:hypothetical protein